MDGAPDSGPLAALDGSDATRDPPSERDDASSAVAHDAQPPSEPMRELGRASLGTTPLPCDLAKVLRVSCQGCHGREPGLQAPMALTSREDLFASSSGDPTRTVWQLARERIHDDARPMPPASSRKLTSDELSLLDEALNAELPAGPEACDDAGEPTHGATSAPAPKPEEIDRCYRLTAHDVAAPGDETPFTVPSGESYGCFFFEIPWEGEAQALTFRSINSPIVHHWLLSDTARASEDGEIIRNAPHCTLDAKRAYAVYGVNQQPELNMPEGVGLQLPVRGQGLGLLLGIHYFNPNGAMEDSSGVEVCTAKSPRPETASVMGLGPAFFVLPPHVATATPSTCTSKSTRDIHILRSYPHMHSRGVSLSTIIERVDGSKETLIDQPFDFNNQLAYDTPAIIRTGDKLVTTCHFNNTTDRILSIGDSTSDEMCINFVTAWPAGSLTTAKDITGADACLE